MRLPRVRFTVRGSAVGVAVVAVNLGLIRVAENLTDRGTAFFVLLPTYALAPSLSLLCVAAAAVAMGLRRQGHASPFSTGYLLLGTVASLAASLALATQAYLLFSVTVRTPEPPSPPPGSLDWCWDALLLVTLSAAPQIALGLIGGTLATRNGLALVVNRRIDQHCASGDV